MPTQLDLHDPRYQTAAAEILWRHRQTYEAEANITSAVRDFLILTGLAKSGEIVEEDPPARGSGRAVDLTALNTFIEFKRRSSSTGGSEPDPQHVRQLDDYLTPIGGGGPRRPHRRPHRRQVLAAALAERRRGQDHPSPRLHAGQRGALVPPVRVAARQGAGLAGGCPARARSHRGGVRTQQPAVRARHSGSREHLPSLRRRRDRHGSSGGSGATCCWRLWARSPGRPPRWTTSSSATPTSAP